jgi:hypothetical protein
MGVGVVGGFIVITETCNDDGASTHITREIIKRKVRS